MRSIVAENRAITFQFYEVRLKGLIINNIILCNLISILRSSIKSILSLKKDVSQNVISILRSSIKSLLKAISFRLSSLFQFYEVRLKDPWRRIKPLPVKISILRSSIKSCMASCFNREL